MSEISGSSGSFKVPSQAKLEIARAQSKETSARQGNNTQAVTQQISNRVEHVYRELKSSVFEKAGSLIGSGANSESLLEEARDITDQELETAENLRGSLRSKDAGATKQAKAKLQDLRQKKTDLSTKAHANNESTVEERSGSIKIGDTISGTFLVPDVNIAPTQSGADALNTVEAVDSFISELKATRSDLDKQSQTIRDVQAEVNRVAGSTRTALNRSDDRPIETFEEARQVSEALIKKLAQAGKADISSVKRGKVQTFHDLSEESVDNLVNG